MGLSSTTISDDRPFAGSILCEMRTHTVRLFYYCGNRILPCSPLHFLVERSACFFFVGFFFVVECERARRYAEHEWKQIMKDEKVDVNIFVFILVFYKHFLDIN